MTMETMVTTSAISEPSWSIKRPGWFATIVYICLAAGGSLLILYAWNLPPFAGPVERTEDAYVQGHTTLIAPQVSGYVETVAVGDFQVVHAGDLLFEIDSRRLRQGVLQAQANLDARIAGLANNRQKLAQSLSDVVLQNAIVARTEAAQTKASADNDRALRLARSGAISRSDTDGALAAFREAVAEVAQAKAAVESSRQAVESVRVNQQALEADVEAARAQLSAAEIDLGYAKIKAPQDGQMSEIGVRKGQYVTPGAVLTFLVPPDRWVIANYKEGQTHAMAAGQRAWFTVDALGGGLVCARVDRIAPATGAQFSALKPDNATGNFTKVPQRIPVRIVIGEGQPIAKRLGPGMSVVLFIDTADGKGPCP
jgi:multidrug resistance efflux pump